MKGLCKSLYLALCVLIASVSAASSASVPTGPNAQAFLDCDWSPTYSETACEALIASLASLERRNHEEQFALLNAKHTMSLHRRDPMPETEYCAGIRSILEDHADYTDALMRYFYCVDDNAERVQLLRKVLEVEPDNFYALNWAVMLIDEIYIPGSGYESFLSDPETHARYREAFYKSSKARAEWQLLHAPSDAVSSGTIWIKLFKAADNIYVAALRSGDLSGAAEIQARVRRDTNLDSLDLNATNSCNDKREDCKRGTHEYKLNLACLTILSRLDLEDACFSAFKQLADGYSAKGQAIPDNVLKKIESMVNVLRQKACGTMGRYRDQCQGKHATESETVAQIRSMLANYAGSWSSEHHRVYAQAFLGDRERLERLRTSLRIDPDNAQARCDLALALAAREKTKEAKETLGDGDPECLKYPNRGFTFVDHEDFIAVNEKKWK